jgi:hypothetical protein
MKSILFLLAAVLAWPGSTTLILNLATVQADGLTLQILIGGCTAPLSLSSGAIITGLTVYDVQDGAGRFQTIASSSISGCTLTIVLALPINNSTDDTVTLTLAVSPGSNLTDAAGNSPSAKANTNRPVTNNSTWSATGGSATLFARMQGGIYIVSGDGNPQIGQWNSSDGFLEFQGSISSINAIVFEYNETHWVLLQDNVQIYDWGVLGSTLVWLPLGAVTGLTGNHTYAIVQVNSDAVPFQMSLLRSIQVIGTPGSLPAARPIVAESGNSLVSLAGTTPPTNSIAAHMWISSNPFGAVDQHVGAAGYTVYGAGGIAASAPSWYTGFGGAPVVAYLRGGGNDIVAGVSTANFNTAWGTYIAGVKGVPQPPAHIVCLGITNNLAQYTLLQAQTYNAFIQSQCVAGGGVYVDTTLWIGGTTDRQSDGIHFNPAGELLWANRLTPITAGYLAGSSYSTSGPMFGTVGSPSTNFTVTLAGGAIFEPDSDSVARETITLNDGGAGGTFVSSVGPSGIGPLAVSAALGTSWTFTYKPAIVTTATITFTSTPALGWKDPASFSFNSRASTLPASTMRGQATMRGVSVIR